MTSVVITGITGLANRGVEALLRPTVDAIHRRAPQCDITVLTNTPGYDAARMREPYLTHLRGNLRLGSGRRVRLEQRLGAVLGQRFLAEPQTDAADAIRSASLVIASGGDVFSSDYGNLSHHLRPLELAQRHGVPVVFLAHSIGPFASAEEADAWVRVARSAPLITVRESPTYRYVTEQLAVSATRVALTADPGFLLAPPPEATVGKMLASLGVQPGRPLVALVISQGISRFAGIGEEEHLETWRRVVRMLTQEAGVHVLLVPHVQTAAPANNDRLLATQLMRSVDYDPRVRLTGGELSASELKGLIGACDMAVAERMHGAVAALSSGVCTVVVGYSVKARGIMADLLGPDLARDRLVIPVEAFLDVGVAYDAIHTAWQMRHDIEDVLAGAVPKIKGRAERNFDLLAPFLQ